MTVTGRLWGLEIRMSMTGDAMNELAAAAGALT